MNETPRLRSAFPPTPRTELRFRGATPAQRKSHAFSKASTPDSARPSPITRPVKHLAKEQKGTDGPLIPFDIIDPPTQRLYFTVIYLGLTIWRLYSSWRVPEQQDSTWQFMFWTGIDFALFSILLPAMRLPFLEFSAMSTVSICLLHLIANAFLMFRIPVPLGVWLSGLGKLVYDRELSVSELSVNPGDIRYNDSVILGKQIIHILPEGSAILNPDRLNFCLDTNRPSVSLPIQINQTTPMSVEFVRYDLQTDEEETIKISGKQARQLKIQADKGYAKSDTKTPRTLQYSVSRTGIYRLERVVDESKLEVRSRSHDVAVVACPSATVKGASEHGCTGDLSKMSIGVEGVPPFKVKYSKRINNQQFSSIVQSIQPGTDDTGAIDGTSNVVVNPSRPNVPWSHLSFDINEVLGKNGSWVYTIEDVEDGLGNKVSYDPGNEKELLRNQRTGSLTVHHKPVVDLTGCGNEQRLRVAKEDTIKLPVRIRPIGQLPASDWPLRIKYSFTPEPGDEVPLLEVKEQQMPSARDMPRINKAGQYTIDSLESQFCRAEIVEPSSCSLYNPPKPSLSIEAEDIFDKCAGNPVGMNVNLDFTGSPPFKVRYVVTHSGMATPKVQEFKNMRGQLEFREKAAGSYIYQFLEIQDDVYSPISLKDSDLILKQDIKPLASASFVSSDELKACLVEPTALSVKLVGEAPWTLEYEVVHGGKRKKHSIQTDESAFTIPFDAQNEGGEYIVILTGVQDSSKCKSTLREEKRIQVRPEAPRAAFGEVDGRRSISALEGKAVKLPLRLKGLGPWTLQLRNIDNGGLPEEHVIKNANAYHSVYRAGTYEIVSVRDECPGTVDPKASTFTITWVPRPKLSIKDTQVTSGQTGSHTKAPVCQGDSSNLGLSLTGSPPYTVKYTQRFEPIRGSPSISNKPVSFTGNGGSINLDTSKAGEYTYVFNELGDERYSHDRKHFRPIVVKQQVFAPPTAKFGEAGKTYSYCKDDSSLSARSSDTEKIPITLTGSPPFSLEIAINHHGVSPRPEIKKIKDIMSNNYQWGISRSSLELGTHKIAVRSVKDSRGCENFLDAELSFVQISVTSPPAIVPLESNIDYCPGEHIAFSLSGQAPFDVYYNFDGVDKKAHVKNNVFRRIADMSGKFTITGISDAAMGGGGKCRAKKEITKMLRPFPTVRVSRGKTLINDIHEGGQVEITFEFTGTPPFEFTYTRSENAKKGKRARVLETRHDTSAGYVKKIYASDEGTYEAVSIKDRYCAYPRESRGRGAAENQKLLQY